MISLESLPGTRVCPRRGRDWGGWWKAASRGGRHGWLRCLSRPSWMLTIFLTLTSYGSLSAQTTSSADHDQSRKERLLKHAESLIAGTLPSPRQLRPKAEVAIPEREAPPASESHPPIRRIRLASHPHPKPEIPRQRPQAVRGRAVPAPMPAMVPASESSSPMPPVAFAKLSQEALERGSPTGTEAMVVEQELPSTTMVPAEPIMPTEIPAEHIKIPPQSTVMLPTASSRPSLDIRPRNLDSQAPHLVPQADLPQDSSGLPPAPTHVTYLPSQTTDVRPIDVCASARFYHKPLYFEDKYLERYGQAPGILRNADGLRSTVHFFWSTATLPLHMWHVCPWECVPTECLMRANCNCSH